LSSRKPSTDRSQCSITGDRTVVGLRSSVAECPHLCVHRVHLGLDEGDQGPQIIPVRHVCRIDRIEDSHRCMTGEEEPRTWLGDTFCTFDDDREKRETGIDRNTEGTPLERQQFSFRAARPLGEDQQGVPAFCRDTDTLVDRPSRRSPLVTIYLDDPDRSHGLSDHGDLEDLLLCEESSVKRERLEEQWDIEYRKVIRRHDVSLIWVNFFCTDDIDTGRWDLQPQTGPEFDDLVVDRCGGANRSVYDDDSGKQQCE